MGVEKRTSHAFSDASQALRSRDGLIIRSTPPRSSTRAAQFSQSELDEAEPFAVPLEGDHLRSPRRGAR